MNLAESTIVHRLATDEQAHWVALVRRVCEESPLVRPSTPNGLPMAVMVTAAGRLGWTGGPGGYRYEPLDSRGYPWPEMPREWTDLANAVAGEQPWDSAIVNWYGPGASLGWHADKSEADTSLPIVTVSLGDGCSWAVRDDDGTASRCRLESGDVTLLAGATRGLLHSVERLYPTPMFSPLRKPGRLSITLRVAGAGLVVAITGGRDTRPTRASLNAFSAWCERLGVATVRHGDCPLRRRKSDGEWTSVDRLVAAAVPHLADPWPALWNRFPRWEAGPRRNGAMLSGDRSDWGRDPEVQVVRLVAWPGGPGTTDCRKQAAALGVRIIDAADIEAWHARRAI